MGRDDGWRAARAWSAVVCVTVFAALACSAAREAERTESRAPGPAGARTGPATPDPTPEPAQGDEPAAHDMLATAPGEAPAGTPSANRPPDAAPATNRPPADTSGAARPGALDPNLPPDIAAALAYDPDDPLANLETADALDRHAGTLAEPTRVPRRGCAAAGGALRVWPRGGPPAIAAIGDGFVLAGYERRHADEIAYLVAIPDRGMPRPLGTLKLATPFPRERIAPPGLGARDASHATLAVIDGDGALAVAEIHSAGGGAGALVPLARAVDGRFAPAVAYTGARALVAWTEGSTPMRTHVAVLDGTRTLAEHDITPPGAGAAAPAFIAGTTPPSLLVVDAHEGMSPMLRIDFAADGTPRPAVTAIVVGAVASPPEVAAARVGRYAWLGYTAVGNAATAAVGLAQLTPTTGAPSSFVRGTAYGRLHVAAVAGGEVAVFAADAPTAAGKDPPHRIEVHVVDAEGAGPPHRVEVAGGASHVAIAHNDAGLIGVAYTTPTGVYLTRLRCDDATVAATGKVL